MLRYGHGAGGVHLTHFTANITGKEQRKIYKKRIKKQRKTAKRKLNNGLDSTDIGIIVLRNKIMILEASMQEILMNNRRKISLKNEEKIKQKQLQIKRLNEQLKEALNVAARGFKNHKKTDKKKKNGDIVKTEKGLTSQKEHKNSKGENINSSFTREYDNKISIKISSQKSSSNNSSTRVKQEQMCKDCIFMELTTFQCKVLHNSCIGKKCGKYKKSRGLYGIVQ